MIFFVQLRSHERSRAGASIDSSLTLVVRRPNYVNKVYLYDPYIFHISGLYNNIFQYDHKTGIINIAVPNSIIHVPNV